MTNAETDITWREKASALLRVAEFNPKLTGGLVFLGALVALLEGVGLSFIWPIIEVARAENGVTDADGILGVFLEFYQFIGIPFQIEYLILGIALVMTIRFTSSFIAAWLKAVLQKNYEETLRRQTFEGALDARVAYFDEAGSDDILNSIITETRYSGKVIADGVLAMETLFLIGMYFAVMFYVSPLMAALAIVLLGGITVFLRHVLEPAYTVGSRVASANQSVQSAVQAGTQGIRDVKLFGMVSEVYDDFSTHLDQYTSSSIRLERNNAALQNFYDLAAALSLFALIYVGFVLSSLELGQLAIFLFAMFRISPLASRFNKHFYQMEGNLSHLVRTQAFVDELEGRREDDGDRPIDEIERITFEDVHFAYEENEPVLRGLSFSVEKGEFIGFVGQSGAGKSTVVSLLTRLYDPASGTITANGTLIENYDLEQWRSRIAIVRQQPYIFNDTLEQNVTIGNRDASRDKVERVCEIARVDEFLDELPNGYESQLGDDGVRLSGGQRQRVALARALLKDADFLVLDEATSDLDSSLERDVQSAIESMDREYGIITIAHRLSTVSNADRIYTVDHGEIIERGPHEELLSDNGEYAELYGIQSNN